MSSKIGHVTQERYDQLVAEGRELIEVQTRCNFALGDQALEIEPMRPYGGSVAVADETFLVSTSLQMFADDLGIPAASLRTYRWVAARWPAEHRQPKVSYGIHKILANISDETRRYATITDPPLHTRTGERRWTEDAARREVGQQVEHPVTVQEKVERIHDLARDEQVRPWWPPICCAGRRSHSRR